MKDRRYQVRIAIKLTQCGMVACNDFDLARRVAPLFVRLHLNA